MAGLKTGPSTPGLQSLAIPAVWSLVIFLGYYSQWLFNFSPDLKPGPLTTGETITFNVLLACLWYTYYKACTVDPGRYFPAPNKKTDDAEPAITKPNDDPSTSASTPPTAPQRWCKKCAAPKPPRAHHCRHCARCVPKMDHHCPWTGNCVSLQTFPYFLRFLVFTNVSLWLLGYHLSRRLAGIWTDRLLPAYLGPTLPQLIGLTLLSLVGAATTLALGILLWTTVRGWVVNMTMIESWEMERHEAVMERYARPAGWWDEEEEEEEDRDTSSARRTGAQGMIPEKVEFPYDLGLFANMAQAMGTRNPLLWFFPFAGGPVIQQRQKMAPGRVMGKGTGWEWEENGFNPRLGMWPPADPEKLRRARAGGWPGASLSARKASAEILDESASTPEGMKAAFARRQEADMLRRKAAQMAGKSGIIAELEEFDELDEVREYYDDEDETKARGDGDSRVGRFEQGLDGEPGWTNSDGDRLRDYGVDEDAEDDELIPMGGSGVGDVGHDDDDDEDVPIAELLRRRRTARAVDTES